MERNEWLEWRRSGIGSSDAPVIMEVSPYKSIEKLRLEKRGEIEEKDLSNNWAVDRGNRVEPVVRAKYEILHDVEMPPSFFTLQEYDFFKASLDGFNEEKRIGIEIKVPGEKDHALAKEGKVPEKYFPQIQHQLLVTGGEYIDYVSYYLEKGQDEATGHMAIVRVMPDLSFLESYLKKALEFWERKENGPEYPKKKRKKKEKPSDTLDE